MTITSSTVEPGIVAVTVDYPPVNAIPSRGWFELADTITAAGRDLSVHHFAQVKGPGAFEGEVGRLGYHHRVGQCTN
jgi:hypothetical protein